MAETKTDARNARLAAALKENLKRRKTQARNKANPPGASKSQELSASPEGRAGDGLESGPKFAPNRD